MSQYLDGLQMDLIHGAQSLAFTERECWVSIIEALNSQRNSNPGYGRKVTDIGYIQIPGYV